MAARLPALPQPSLGPSTQAVLSGLAASVAGVARVLLVATVFIAAWAACGLQLFMGGQHACTAAKCCSVPQDDLTCKVGGEVGGPSRRHGRGAPCQQGACP